MTEYFNPTMLSLINISENFTEVSNQSKFDGSNDDDNIIDNRNYAEIERKITIFTSPVIIVFGTIGNMLSFYVMRRGSMKDVSTCFYMSLLAVADTGMLWCGSGFRWIYNLTKYNVNPFCWTDCKLTYFLYYFFQHFSSALLVIMSIEKCFALYFPLKTRGICTVKTAKWVTFITAVLYIAFESQFFFIVEARGCVNYCIFVNVPDNYPLTLNRIDSVLFSFGPFTIMSLTNLAIIYKFVKAKLKSNNEGTESTNQALSKSATKGIVMLLTVSITFIALTGPSAVTFAVTHSPPPLLLLVLNLLVELNHAINAVLYCIVGSRFRTELLNVLCCRHQRGSDRSLSQSGTSRRTTKSCVATATVNDISDTGSTIKY